MNSGRGLALLLAVIAGISWGLLGPATKILFAQVPAAFDGPSVGVARAAWSFPIFLFWFAGAIMFERPRMAIRYWAALALAGVAFGLGIIYVFSVAAAQTSVSHLSFLIGSSPVINSIVAAAVFRLPLGMREKTALALGILGVTLLAISRTGGSAGLAGDSLMLVWLAAFALYAVLVRYVGPRVSASVLMSFIGIVATFAVLAFAAFVPGAYRGIGHVTDTATVSWWFFGDIVLGSTIVGQLGYAIAVRRAGIAVATIGAQYTTLTVGTIASVALHETWTPLTALAGAILACALAATFVRLPVRKSAGAGSISTL